MKRDPRPQVAMEQLAALISPATPSHSPNVPARELKQLPICRRHAIPCLMSSLTSHTTAQLAAPSTGEPLIGTACLELSPALHEQIKEYVGALQVDTTVFR